MQLTFNMASETAPHNRTGLSEPTDSFFPLNSNPAATVSKHTKYIHSWNYRETYIKWYMRHVMMERNTNVIQDQNICPNLNTELVKGFAIVAESVFLWQHVVKKSHITYFWSWAKNKWVVVRKWLLWVFSEVDNCFIKNADYWRVGLHDIAIF